MQVDLNRSVQRDIAGLILMVAGVMTILTGWSVVAGPLGAGWAGLVRRVFGWGLYPVAAALVVLGLVVIWEPLGQRLVSLTRQIVGLEVVFLALLGLTHALINPEVAFQVAEGGSGGGYIGWAISHILAAAIGRPLSIILLVVAAGAGAALLTGLDWHQFRDWMFRLRSWLERPQLPSELPLSPSEPKETLAPVGRERKGHRRTAADPDRRPAPVETLAPRPRRKARDRRLPPLDLLEAEAQGIYSEADVEFRKQVIEETLASFGVPASVVEIRRGPTVTQFGVEPGFLEFSSSDGDKRLRKVRVSKIMSLQDDLSLALAASPLRIEAPVPGRSVVGIEVPNIKPSLVRLRSVVESPSFSRMDSRLRVALGKDVAGQPMVADLAQMPHVLIAGATGSGKSVCINAFVACLLLENTPDDVRMLMIDPKMVELTIFNGIPHLLAPVITKVEEAVRALLWVTKQMDERFRLFARRAVRDIERYNKLADNSGDERLPRLVVLIDELADLMMTAPDEIERSICRIAQMARATGIHLVIATQRPSVDVVTGLIKANFPARISFAVTSQVDSRVILDTMGAEKLLSRGDMLYMAPDSSKLVRLQGCFVSDVEAQRLADFWREKVDWMAPESESGVVPWQGMDEENEGSDDLLDEAIALAQGRQTLSTSFIQRRLRVGYPRAAHLMDILESRGIVGPAENAGRSREVLLGEEDAGGASAGGMEG